MFSLLVGKYTGGITQKLISKKKRLKKMYEFACPLFPQIKKERWNTEQENILKRL